VDVERDVVDGANGMRAVKDFGERADLNEGHCG
jgi:hypothetical protein